MNALESLEKREIRELLYKGWMTHDAMWFYHCSQEFGIEKTNKVNTAAVLSMSAIEIQRLKKAIGFDKDNIDTFDELVDFMMKVLDIVKPDFMHFNWSFPQHNVIHWEWEKDNCFAFKGISQLGLVDRYHCGILKRIEGWFINLKLPYKMDPEVEGCLMHQCGQCHGDIIFSF